ncbi:unnamed protein product [Sympodiomycopsis kandeliae]
MEDDARKDKQEQSSAVIQESSTPASVLNPLALNADIEEPPSLRFGVPRELELDLRAYGAQVIHRLGRLLELPQRLTATAQVLFQRFWYTTSFTQFSCLDVSVAAVFLASKLEEFPIRIRDLINSFGYIVQRDRHLSKLPSGGSPWSEKQGANHEAGQSDFQYAPHTYHSDIFYNYKDSLVVHEMQILKRLAFQTEALLPYATLVNYLQVMGFGRDKAIVQQCWSYCSDMLQTPLPAMLPPHVLSVAAIYYLSIQKDTIMPVLPRQPAPWWTLFDVDVEEIHVVCAWLQQLYDDQKGTASRVRAECGGLVDLATKEGLRRWLAEKGKGKERDGADE